MKKLIISLLICCTSMAYAGQGFIITMHNKSQTSVTTSVSRANCIYDANKLNKTMPAGSSTEDIYIESKNSGTCFFKHLDVSSYTLHILKANGEAADIQYYYTGTHDANGNCIRGHCFNTTNADVAPNPAISDSDPMRIKINIY